MSEVVWKEDADDEAYQDIKYKAFAGHVEERRLR